LTSARNLAGLANSRETETKFFRQSAMLSVILRPLNRSYN